MNKDLRRNILLVLLVIVASIGAGFFLWDEVKLEGKRLDLSRVCHGLKSNASLAEIQSVVDSNPQMQLVLLSPDAEDRQVGGIAIAGATSWACNLVLYRGRLVESTFSSAGPTGPGGAPRPKLKSW